jgi:hypothetical protein
MASLVKRTSPSAATLGQLVHQSSCENVRELFQGTAMSRVPTGMTSLEELSIRHVLKCVQVPQG